MNILTEVLQQKLWTSQYKSVKINLAALIISPKMKSLSSSKLVRNAVPVLRPVITHGHLVSAAEWVAAASTLPLGWAETGRWSRGCQWPGLWSRAAAVCKRFSSWRAPRWHPPASTERSVSHTGCRSPRLVSGEEEGRRRGKEDGEEDEREREKKKKRILK